VGETRKPIPTLVKDQELVRLRRGQIIRAAVELFVEKGFHKTTTREIARATGIGIGTLYEYIQSKEDVLYLVCDYIHTDVEEKLTALLAEQRTGRDTLVHAIRSFFKIMDEMQDYVLLIYQESKSLPDEMLRYVLAKEEFIMRHFEKILERGAKDGSLSIEEGSRKLMAHNITVLGQMWAFRRWFLRRYYTLEQYTERQVSLLLKEMS
jgi:TetR/AcrR family transcriptional regulator, cholesterol catabolism regulator